MVDRLRSSFAHDQVAVAHIYSNYKNQDFQTLERVTASLLKQLARAQSETPRAVEALYDRLSQQQAAAAPQKELAETLLLTCKTYRKVFFCYRCSRRVHIYAQEEFSGGSQ